MGRFVHLRNHTEYSICSGTIKLEEKVKDDNSDDDIKTNNNIFYYTKQYNMPACAITDSNAMFGILQFSSLAVENGIQPIIGCEILLEAKKYINSDINPNKNYSKLVLLAQNDIGFQNLIKLNSKSYVEKIPNVVANVKYDWLSEYSEGIICLSGGFEGLIGQLLLKNEKSEAEEVLLNLKNIFGDRFYIELSRHGLIEENKIEKDFINFAYKYNIPLVATNDCYFLTKDMYEACDILYRIGEKYIKSDDITDIYKINQEYYFKTQEEMEELFIDIPEAIENTYKIAQRITTMAYSRKPTLPHFPIPNGSTEQEYLRELAIKGLEERLQNKYMLENIIEQEKKDEIHKIYFDQLEYELKVIIELDFCGYFLIVRDFCIWSKENDVPVGPGRGSGAGSVVAWAIKITNVDPKKYNLFFERFLNIERRSMPDFDIDFCFRGRSKTINYIKEKYGKDMVGQIVTFGKLQSRAVIKDVGRVLEYKYGRVDEIAKLISMDSKNDLRKEIKQNEALKNKIESEGLQNLINYSLKLEKLNRNTSIHAGGVVIGDKPLDQICPLYFDNDDKKQGKKNNNDEIIDKSMPVVQYSYAFAEQVGLVKFDFLGLKTLTIIKDTLTYLKNRNIDINLELIDLDDKKIYDNIYAIADTVGVFQVESSGMKNNLLQLKPNNIEEITALISLFRPGPMGNIPTYINRKYGKEKIEYLHPKLEPILKNTYGIIIYQEQVLEIAKQLAGYSLGEADILRKAMGKKKKDIMIQEGKKFCERAFKINGIDKNLLQQIFDFCQKFAEYGFNKAHAVSYSIISYQTAFLKYYYPVEFIVANLNMEINDDERIKIFVGELKKYNIKLLPPDINLSDSEFKIEKIKIIGEKDKNSKKYDGDYELAVRYGLAGLKGIGTNIGNEIMLDREKNGLYKTIWDFAKRNTTKVVNKKVVETFAKAGVFDSLYSNRKEIVEGQDILSSYCETSKKQQLSLFDALPNLKSFVDYSNLEKYKADYEAYGFYIWGHPLDSYRLKLIDRGITFFNELKSSDSTIEENNDKEEIDQFNELEYNDNNSEEDDGIKIVKFKEPDLPKLYSELDDGDIIYVSGIVIKLDQKRANKKEESNKKDEKENENNSKSHQDKAYFIILDDGTEEMFVNVKNSRIINDNRTLLSEKKKEKESDKQKKTIEEINNENRISGAIVLKCKVFKRNNKINLSIKDEGENTKIYTLEEFIENNPVGSIKKITKSPKKYTDTSDYTFQIKKNDINTENYKKELIIENKNVMYNEINIFINSVYLKDLKDLLSKIEDKNVSFSTKIVIHIKDKPTFKPFKLGDYYKIYNVEFEQIKKINSVEIGNFS